MTAQSETRDKIDMKIIGLLLEDARKSFAEVGKELGISKNAVWSRYKNMTKAGIIKGATVEINYKGLGYDSVGTIRMEVEPPQIEKVSRFIKARVPDVFGPFSTASRYNLRAVMALRNISDLGKIKEELTSKLGITKISSALWTDIWFTPENLSLIPVRPTEVTNKKSAANSAFDVYGLDLKLIRELAKDSRISFRSLAKKLDVSVDTVARRYERLKENRVVVSRVQIDPTKIGYHALVNFYLRVMPHYDLDAVIREILQVQDVFYTMKCSGDFHVGLILMAKTIQDILGTGDRITGIPGVKRIETVVSEIYEKWPLPRTYTSMVGKNLTVA